MRENLIDTLSVIREIGSGGFGRVYLAKAPSGELYALKQIYTTDPAYYKKEIKSLKLYSKLTRQLEAKNIIPILDVRITDTVVEYLMPLSDGIGADSPLNQSWKPKTLTSLVLTRYESGGTFTAKEVVEIFKPLLEAVAALNEAGFIHRDIKPDNILFIGGQPYIADIGLLREDTDSASSVGTPVYSPPSWYTKIAGNPDMWGIATTLYFFLSGNSPDTIGRPNYMFPSTKEKMSKDDIKAWHHFHRVILRATRENPTERYSTISDLAADILDTKEKRNVVYFSEYATVQQSTSIFLTSGRVNRKTYTLCFILFFLLINFCGAIDAQFAPLGSLFGYILFWPLFALNAKRTHDAGIGIAFAIFASLLVVILWYINILVASGVLPTPAILDYIIRLMGVDSEITRALVIRAILDIVIWILFYTIFVFLPHNKGTNKYGIQSQRLSFF